MLSYRLVLNFDDMEHQSPAVAATEHTEDDDGHDFQEGAFETVSSRDV